MNGEHKIKQAYRSILQHDFEQAIDWFHQAVNEEPNNADYHYRLSITYARSNKLPPAIEHAKQAVKLQPEQFIFRNHYCNVLARELVQEAGRKMEQGIGDLNEVVSMLKQAIQLDSLYLEAYMLLGVAYMGQKRYSLAKQSLLEARRLDPLREDVKALLQQLDQNEQSINH
ncbi:MAG: repeat-containing protein [Paenibacillus sp.]|nr:repeat-containing protein [Paenibacillus sp.]